MIGCWYHNVYCNVFARKINEEMDALAERLVKLRTVVENPLRKYLLQTNEQSQEPEHDLTELATHSSDGSPRKRKATTSKSRRKKAKLHETKLAVTDNFKIVTRKKGKIFAALKKIQWLVDLQLEIADVWDIFGQSFTKKNSIRYLKGMWDKLAMYQAKDDPHCFMFTNVKSQWHKGDVHKVCLQFAHLPQLKLCATLHGNHANEKHVEIQALPLSVQALLEEPHLPFLQTGDWLQGPAPEQTQAMQQPPSDSWMCTGCNFMNPATVIDCVQLSHVNTFKP